MPRPDPGNAAVDRGDLGKAEALGDGHDRGIDRSQRQVGVAEDEFGGASPVPGFQIDDGQVTVGQRCEECRLGSCACFSCEQVAGFGDDGEGRARTSPLRWAAVNGPRSAMVPVASQGSCDSGRCRQDHADVDRAFTKDLLYTLGHIGRGS